MSEEVKIYRGTTPLGETCLLRRIGGWQSTGEGLFKRIANSPIDSFMEWRERDITNLAELTFHPKGEKVCLDVHPYVMRRFLHYVELKESERSPIIAYKFEDLRTDLLAQLTPSAEGGAGEFKDWNDIAKDYEASHPAKVGIELTEEETRDFIEMGSLAPQVIEKIRQQVCEQFVDLTPAPMPEPLYFGERVMAASNCSVEVLEWKLIPWGGEHKWMTLMGNALCLCDWSDLINPTRVAGAE